MAATLVMTAPFQIVYLLITKFILAAWTVGPKRLLYFKKLELHLTATYTTTNTQIYPFTVSQKLKI